MEKKNYQIKFGEKPEKSEKSLEKSPEKSPEKSAAYVFSIQYCSKINESPLGALQGAQSLISLYSLTKALLQALYIPFGRLARRAKQLKNSKVNFHSPKKGNISKEKA